MVAYTLNLDEDIVKQLDRLVGPGDYLEDSVEDLLAVLARTAADGVRRSGSWERDWILQATGAELRG